jgi:hypothetical protein
MVFATAYGINVPSDLRIVDWHCLKATSVLQCRLTRAVISTSAIGQAAP